MIELQEKDIMTNSNRSSKGNQLKWLSDNYWYKADYTGYEGLSEIIVSKMLEYSNLNSDEYVKYDPVIIKYKKNIFCGCMSKNFLREGQQLITLERLYKNFYGDSFYGKIFRISDINKRCEFLCAQVARMTGITDFYKYFQKVMTIDALSLNEDRHLHNIAVILNADGSYELCPLFDHGAALLADITLDYPLNGDIYELIESVHAKTIASDFDEQLDAAERMTGLNIKFTFTKKDVHNWLNDENLVQMYTGEILDRVEKIIFERMRKYKYLFC